ncbi:MAG TPA: glycerate kinase [Bacteroidales bacterium]|jgi:glycerate-2-kinase|nr:glycerate kinase [Bacteroidales bacterium]HOG57493.1 glycerate kinase [Bacteroidales bacterium]HPX44321.1 glycerate kinase [Bacteroidales bacterium]HQB86850.1 glycerate kinase [Bacteroidales bacterium]
MRNRDNALRIFLAGVRGVLPEKLVTDVLQLKGQVLVAGNHEVSLEGIEKILVIGAGKASAAMGHYVECILGDRISGGHIVVKYGHSCTLKKIRVTEAGHPVPDENGFMAAREIKKIASDASANDLVICLISGGASALLSDLPEGLIPEELYIVNNLLIRSGATINEINCVRKHLSSIKGGQLVRTIRPARLITLIISDVIGNHLDVIGSGPTVPDSTTFADALGVIEKYNLTDDVTRGVMNYLRDGYAGYHPDTPKPGNLIFEGTMNIIAGTNQAALRACKNEAVKLGYRSYIIDAALEDDVETACESIINTALSFRNNQDIPKPACLLYGGETSVRVTGSGTGGRNQHLALSAAIKLRDIPGITVLSAGTDGTDGPTDAAGAVADSGTMARALSMNEDPISYLAGFDSFNFFRKVGGLITTGPTFTNVMDIVVVIVE